MRQNRNDAWLYSGLGVFLFFTVYGVWVAEVDILDRLLFVTIGVPVLGILLALVARRAFGFTSRAVQIVAVILVLLAAAFFTVIFWLASKIP